MDGAAAHDVLEEVEGVRRRARADRRPTSVPLLVFGAITLVDALLQTATDPFRNFGLVFLGPIGFALVALHYQRREVETGVGRPARPYLIAAVVSLLFVPFFVLLGAQVLVGLGLLVIAVGQRNRYLSLWAVVCGVVGGLEAFYVFSNRLYELAEAFGFYSDSYGYFSWASSVVFGLLGLALVLAGLHARRRELGPP